MIHSLVSEVSLRCVFEELSKIILRRKNKHNYLFSCRQFDSLQQLLNRYKIILQNDYDFLETNWKKCDLIECIINENRIIQKIILYEVKTKWHNAKTNKYEFCKTNFDFMNKASKDYDTKIASIVMLPNWRFSFNIYNFQDVPKRIYNNGIFRKKN